MFHIEFLVDLSLFLYFVVFVDNNQNWKRKIKIRYAELNYNVNVGEELEFESDFGRGNDERWPPKQMPLIELPAGKNWFRVIYAKTVELCNLNSFHSIDYDRFVMIRNCSSMTRSAWSNTQSTPFESSQNWLSVDHVRLTFFLPTNRSMFSLRCINEIYLEMLICTIELAVAGQLKMDYVHLC